MALQNPWDDYLGGPTHDDAIRAGNGGFTGGNTGSGIQPVPNADVSALYREILGRDPDANELSTDTENLGKYGADTLRNTLTERRGNLQPQQQRVNMPGLQFDDAYSNLLEQIAQKQMGEVRSNPGLDQLMSFLTKQFQDLSTNPGYSPAEQAMLRTQVFEPIEDNRAASKQRALERTAARGFAPSSGLNELDLRDIDRAADRNRTVADRDLAIAGLDRRDRDLSRALDLGQLLGLTIPKQQRGEEIALGNLLYQMPRTALDDALRVISGTPSSNDAFSQAIRLLEQQYAQQGRSDANNAALYGQIGQILANIFR